MGSGQCELQGPPSGRPEMQRSLTTERHRPRHASTKNPVQTLIPATSGGRALILPSHFSLVTVRCSHVVLSCHDIPCDLLSGWEVDRQIGRASCRERVCQYV